MQVEVSRHKDGAIEFRKGNGMMFYDISESEQEKGFVFWDEHLSLKKWFTIEVAYKFSQVWWS